MFMIRGTFSTLMAGFLLIFAWNVPRAMAQDSDLVTMLVQQLGVTATQAQGGAGAIFNLAKEKMQAQAFEQVASAVPNMDTLLRAAPKSTSGLGGMFGSGTSLLGGANGNLGSLATLASSFSQLGLSPDMVNQFVPIVLSFVQGNGGESVSQLLAAVLQ